MSDFPTRREKANPDIRMLATLMYILEQEDKEDYVVLQLVKILQYMNKAARTDIIAKILNIEEKDLYLYLQRMRSKGWIGIRNGYVSVIGAGDPEIWKIRGRVSQVIHSFNNNKPIPEWKKQSKKLKK